MIALVVHREKPWLARSRAWRSAERFLLMAGLLALAFAAYTYAARFIYQARENWIFERALATTGAPLPAPQKTAERRQTTALTLLLIGKITIPRLGISAIVKEGIAEKTLRLAVGHFPSTALPGQPGNVGLAAHRDSLFRRLKDVQRDDEITFTTLEGKYVYRVISFNVVNPTEVSVLAPSTGENTLTLVTCYPFYFVGHAPKRFIVRARQVRSIPQPEEPSVHLSGTSLVEVVRGVDSPRVQEHAAACAEPLRRFDPVTTLFGQKRARIKRMVPKRPRAMAGDGRWQSPFSASLFGVRDAQFHMGENRSPVQRYSVRKSWRVSENVIHMHRKHFELVSNGTVVETPASVANSIAWTSVS